MNLRLNRRVGPYLLVAALGPFLTVTAYLYGSRLSPYRFTPASDYAALTASVVLGVGGLVVALRRLRCPAAAWVAAAMAYCISLPGVLFLYSLSFVCAAFRDCF